MKIAVLTSGGDSAGMNAAVRSVVKFGILRCALSLRTRNQDSEWRLILVVQIIEDAILGLCARDMKALFLEILEKITIKTPILLIT